MWEIAIKTPDLKVVEDFARIVELTGKNFNADILVDYGNELLNYTYQINIESMEKQLKQFPDLKNKLFVRLK